MKGGVPRGMERYVVRVGHDEREACQGQLLEQHLAGRLSAEELDERQRAAMEAVTVADLERLLVDLPHRRTRPRTALVRAPRRRPDGRLAVRAAVPVAAVGATGAWLGAAAQWGDAATTAGAALATGVVGVVTGWWAGRRR